MYVTPRSDRYIQTCCPYVRIRAHFLSFDPRVPPVMITIFTQVVRTSVFIIQNQTKSLQAGTIRLAVWIMDGYCLLIHVADHSPGW